MNITGSFRCETIKKKILRMKRYFHIGSVLFNLIKIYVTQKYGRIRVDTWWVWLYKFKRLWSVGEGTGKGQLWLWEVKGGSDKTKVKDTRCKWTGTWGIFTLICHKKGNEDRRKYITLRTLYTPSSSKKNFRKTL